MQEKCAHSRGTRRILHGEVAQTHGLAACAPDTRGAVEHAGHSRAAGEAVAGIGKPPRGVAIPVAPDHLAAAVGAIGAVTRLEVHVAGVDVAHAVLARDVTRTDLGCE